MLAKNQRLTRDQFSSLFESGKRIHGDAFTLIYSPTKDLPKGSVVVSKKIAGNVIIRNLLKRRLYNVLKTGLVFDTILLAKKPVKEMKFEDLVSSYKELLGKIK